jgi:HEAT repeat protein
VTTLGDRLSDPHPDVRRAATRALLGYARRADLRGAVIDRGVRALAAADWRGQEQAAVLLAKLTHRPAAARLVELLRSDRSEAAVAAAWGLRELGVADTLPAALDHVKLRHAQLRTGATPRDFPPDQLDRQLAQLVQLLGAAGYRPADTEFRALFPRIIGRGMPPPLTEVGPETRAAALWALGRLHAGDADAALVRPIQERLTGDGPLLGKDDGRVRRMAAVALARLGARQSVDVLREQGGEQPTLDAADYACRWAAAQLTGRPLPPPGVYEAPQTNWFLVPIG